MCGIIGYQNIEGSPDTDGFLRLIEQSNIRGLHAFGLATVAGVTKSLKPFAAGFIRDTLRSCPAWLYHNRYSTSGDWSEPRNNQPLTREGVSIVMNGVICQEPREVWERVTGWKYLSENDTEILLRKITNGENISVWLQKTKASVAALILLDGKVCAFRNLKRPLRYVQTDTGILVASTADIFRRAGYTQEIKNIEPFKLVWLEELWMSD